MPKIKIVGGPKRKLNRFVGGGPTSCGPGTTWDTVQQKCVPSIQGVQSPMTQMNWGNMGDINGTTVSAPQAPKPNSYTGSGNMWSSLANMVQESNRKDEKLVNQGSYNPFDVKWGQEQNSPYPNVFSDDYLRMMNQVPNSKGATGLGMTSQTQTGDGTLNTAQLTSDFQNVVSTTTKAPSDNLYTPTRKQYLNVGNAVANYVNTYKQQKQYDQYQANNMLPDNTYAVNKGSDRGWYTQGDGMYDPYKMGYKGRREYGGMIQAEEGVIVPGDQTVQAAFLPDVSTDVIGPTRSRPAASPEYASAAPVGETSANSEYVLPVKNFVLTSGFGTRKAPKGPASTNHNGLDLAVPENSDVFAPMDGIVKSIYYNDQGGNQLVVQHPDGSRSGYAHLNGYKVKVGDQIGRGQVIALSGNTGNSSGAHLHFTWRDPSGNPIDPRNVLNFDTKVKNKTKSTLGDQISLTHNNPLNVHYGKFAKEYNGVPGADDSGGKVAKFPDFQTGLQANKDLLFGPAYINLTIAEARNKWVSGSPNVYNSSTDDIIKVMGGNKKLSSLSNEERDKLFKQFAKWEGSQAYNQIKDVKIFKEGGQTNNNKNMKIRIVGGPEHMDKGGEPQYSGQSNYGLYIGQRDLYKTMAKNPYDDAGQNVQEQPESKNNPHVLEAEGGETILRPDGIHMKITGHSHAQGGVKLTKEQAPEGSFIYSDTHKMKIKNPEVLGHFGKKPNKAGITPADIAKQYDVNKYMGILQNPNADNLAKKTAMMMVQNYQRKLVELALVQESKKGFPQGVPDIAKGLMERMKSQQQQGEQPEGQEQQQGMARYGGGLRRFQGDRGGSSVPPYANVPAYNGGIDPGDVGGFGKIMNAPTRKPLPAWFQPWTQSNTKAGKTSPKGPSSTYNYVEGNDVYDDYQYWRDRADRDFKDAGDYQHYVFDEIQRGNPDAYKYMENKWGPTAAGRWDDKIMGARTMFASNTRIPPTKTPPPIIPSITPPPTGTPPETPPGPPTTLPPPFIPPTTMPPGPPERYGWTQQDIRNYMNAGTDYATLQKYHPYRTNIQPVLPEFVPVDWRGQAAALQSSTNAAANQLGAYMPGQSMASNLSALTGQQAESLGKAISGVDQYNAAGASNMDLQRANMLNQFTQYNAQNADNNFADENTLDAKFREAERVARKGIVKTRNQGEDTATKIYNLNKVESPYYQIDPYTQMMHFNDDAARQAWIAKNSGGYQDAAGSGAKAANELKEIYDNLTFIPEDQRVDQAYQIWSGGKGSGRSTNRSYPNQPNKNYNQTVVKTDNDDD